MSDAIRPGEIDLEAAAGDGAAADAGAADTGHDAGDGGAADAGAADAGDAGAAAAGDPGDGGVAKQQPRGAVAELIALRREKKVLAERLQQFESNPVINRLTPEVQQAIMEGRLQIAPPQGSREAEHARLTDVAQTLQLYKVDAQGNTVPDLEAASRVSNFVRTEVRQAVEPVRQSTLAEKAQHNVKLAIQHAEQNGLDVDIIREEFLTVLQQPNGPQMLAQQNIAKQVWRAAVGRMHEEGRLTKKEAKAAVAAGPDGKTPAAVVIEPSGRRGSAGTGIQLSPALQRVYQDNGMDPSKSFTAKNKVNFGGSIDLE